MPSNDRPEEPPPSPYPTGVFLTDLPRVCSCDRMAGDNAGCSVHLHVGTNLISCYGCQRDIWPTGTVTVGYMDAGRDTCTCVHHAGDARDCPCHTPISWMTTTASTTWPDPVSDESEELEETLPLGWVCPRCNTVWAPHIDFCLCHTH